MKLTPFRLLAATALSALLAPAGFANYNPAIVAADARWVIHADFNDLRASELGKELIAALEKAQTGSSGGVIGINIPRLLATIGSVTAYGTNLTPDPEKLDGTLIAQGTPDLRKIVESILLQGTLAEPATFSEVSDLPFAAYAISNRKAVEGQKTDGQKTDGQKADGQKTTGKKTHVVTQLVIAFPPEPIVLVSKSKEQLLKAREVFRGAAPSLKKKGDSPLNQLAANAGGAYLFAASVVPTEPIFNEKGPQARILQLAKSGSIALGERGADLFAHAELTASSDTNAEKLMKILEGLTAMLSLAESNDRQLADFLNSSTVSREKDVVTLKLAYPAARLVQMTQNLRAQAEARPVQKAAVIALGKVVGEWTAAEVKDGGGGLSWRTIENVALANGNLVSLGRSMNGGRDARFERVEVVPASGGASLIFQRDFMRSVRGSLLQFPFPGVEGTYTLKVAFVNDPERKAKFAVSVHDPKASQRKTERPAPPAPPRPQQ